MKPSWIWIRPQRQEQDSFCQASLRSKEDAKNALIIQDMKDSEMEDKGGGPWGSEFSQLLSRQRTAKCFQFTSGLMEPELDLQK